MNPRVGSLTIDDMALLMEAGIERERPDARMRGDRFVEPIATSAHRAWYISLHKKVLVQRHRRSRQH